MPRIQELRFGNEKHDRSTEPENSNIGEPIERQTQIKARVVGYAPMFIVLFLFGTVCALWAQGTDVMRSPGSFLVYYSALLPLSHSCT